MKKLILSVLFFFFAIGLWADERILDFSAKAVVQRDGLVRITEYITINVEHQKIRRGIYRTIPLRFYQKMKVYDVAFDGQEHPYKIEKKSGNYRIDFGDNNYIPRGEHTYTFVYTLENVLGSFPQYDEVYWNVTGNDWAFPIDSAVAEVVLPRGTPVLEDKVSFYTGRAGSKEAHADREGLLFWNTRPFSKGEGLTIAIPFEKGHVDVGWVARLLSWWYRYQLYVAWVLFGLTCWYCYWAWKRVGKDPSSRVIRRFDPPKGISPALAMYISNMGPAQKLLPVTLLSLTMKGVLEMSQTDLDENWVLSKKANAVPLSALSEEEQNLLAVMPSVKVLDGEYDEEVKGWGDFIKENLHLQCGHDYFSRNGKWTLPVWAVLILLMAGFLGNLDGITFLMLIYAVMVSVTSCKKNPAYGIVFLLFMGVLLVFYAASYVRQVLPQLAVLGAFIGLLFFFSRMIRAYTIKGRAVMNEIEGFKQYLSVAESRRVSASDPLDPQKIFCDYLPYAFALGVESEWIESFDDVLTEEKKRWAGNRGLIGTLSFHSMINSMNKSFASATTSSGGSGSGGGGFSGGGFGGGGGGGR
ncbi:DUF2207 domain-containing protein [Candidatus Avelusimicrobium sp.]